MSSRLIRLLNLISVCVVCLLTLGSPLTAAPLAVSKPPQNEAVEVSVIRLRADGTSVSETSVYLASPANCPLPAPALIAPVNGVRVNTLIPVFEWSETGTGQYRIQVSEVSDFSTMTFNHRLHGFPGEIRFYRNLSANTTYFWRVASICSDNSVSEFSATASFSTASITGPFLDPPPMIAPSDGALLGSLSVPFYWGDAPGAVGWQLRFYNSLNNAQIDVPFLSSRADFWIQPVVISFHNPGTYYWRILVHDDIAWGTLSPIRSVTVGADSGDTHRISGLVRDKKGDPVEGVVMSSFWFSPVETDETGYYEITGLEAGTYGYRPSKDGYVFEPDFVTVTVPPDATAQDFTASPGPAAKVDLSISEVTPIQVLERQPLVVGKETAVKVVVNKSGSESVSNAQVTLEYGPDVLSTFYVSEEDNWDGQFRLDEPNNGYPLSFSDSEITKTIYFFGDILGPSDVRIYDVIAEVDPLNLVPETNELNNAAASATAVYEAVWGGLDHPELNLRYVPVGQQRSVALIDYISSQTSFIETTYPVAAHDVRQGVNTRRCFRTPFSYLPDAQGLVSLAGDLWLAGKLADATADRIVGVTPDGWLQSQYPQVIGPTVRGMNLGGVALVEMSSPVGATAHEIGHLYGLWTECEQYDADCDGTWDNLGNPVRGGLRVSDRTVMNDGDTKGETRHGVYSFMGTGNYAPPAIDRFVDAGDYQALTARSSATSQALQSLNAEDGIVMVRGILGKDNSAEFLDWYHLREGTYDQMEPGPCVLRALDGQGTVLSEHHFTMTFTLLGAITPTLQEAPFAFAMPFISGTSEFELQHEGQTLITRTVSTHAPKVMLLSPNGGEVLKDSLAVEWTADDADEDTLTYAVLLSTDNGSTWSTTAVGLTRTLQTVDISSLPPGNGNLVKVVATDGVNTGQDVSDAPFTVLASVYLPLVLRD